MLGEGSSQRLPSLDAQEPQLLGGRRLVTLGMDALGQVPVIIPTPRGGSIRLISARKASGGEAKHYQYA